MTGFGAAEKTETNGVHMPGSPEAREQIEQVYMGVETPEAEADESRRKIGKIISLAGAGVMLALLLSFIICVSLRKSKIGPGTKIQYRQGNGPYQNGPVDGNANGSIYDNANAHNGNANPQGIPDMRYAFISHYAWGALEKKTMSPLEFQRKALGLLLGDKKAEQVSEICGDPETATDTSFNSQISGALGIWQKSQQEIPALKLLGAQRLFALALLLPRVKTGAVKGLSTIMDKTLTVCRGATRELILLSEPALKIEHAAEESRNAYNFLNLENETKSLWPIPDPVKIDDLVITKKGSEDSYTVYQVKGKIDLPGQQELWALAQTAKTEATVSNLVPWAAIKSVVKLTTIGGNQTEKKIDEFVKVDTILKKETLLVCILADKQLNNFAHRLGSGSWNFAFKTMDTLGKLSGSIDVSKFVPKIPGFGGSTAGGKE